MSDNSTSPVAAGTRNKLVSVYQISRNAVVDEAGHVDESNPDNWELLGKHWCGLMPRGSREFFRREQVAADITHQVEMPYSSQANAITTKMKFCFDGRTLAIAEAPRNEYENNHSLVFACKEIK